MKVLLQRPWWLAALVFGATMLPVLLLWQRHREETRRNEAQIFVATTGIVEEQVKLAFVRHLNVFNQLRQQVRVQSALHSALRLPPNFARTYPHLADFGYAARQDGETVLRWTLRERAPAGAQTFLSGQPQWSELLERAAHTALPCAALDPDDERTALVACAVGDGMPAVGFVVGWLDVDALCHDPGIALVREGILVARPLREAEDTASDGRVAILNEGGLRLRVALTRGPAFASAYGPPASWLLLVAGGGGAALLALLAFVGARALGLRAALATERERARLVQGFSHELRTPLSVILSSVDLLAVYADRLTPERRQEALAQIQDAAQRLSGLVDHALLLSRLESGRLEVQLAVHDVGMICRAVAAEIGAATRGRCPIRIEGDGAARCDASLLRSVVANLLENAVKYSAAGGEVSLVVAKRGGELELVVEDRGIGVPRPDLSHLGEPYHRAANVGDVPGTGLGLAIVRRSLEPMRGRIFFVSAEGRGTKVTVTLPAA